MREENKNPELNEAALEGVSGGGNVNYADIAYTSFCRVCDHGSKCGRRYKELGEYLRDHDLPRAFTCCPFYRNV